MSHSVKNIYICCYLSVGNLSMILFDDVRGEGRMAVISVILEQILSRTLLNIYIYFAHPSIVTTLDCFSCLWQHSSKNVADNKDTLTWLS